MGSLKLYEQLDIWRKRLKSREELWNSLYAHPFFLSIIPSLQEGMEIEVEEIEEFYYWHIDRTERKRRKVNLRISETPSIYPSTKELYVRTQLRENGVITYVKCHIAVHEDKAELYAFSNSSPRFGNHNHVITWEKVWQVRHKVDFIPYEEFVENHVQAVRDLEHRAWRGV